MSAVNNIPDVEAGRPMSAGEENRVRSSVRELTRVQYGGGDPGYRGRAGVLSAPVAGPVALVRMRADLLFVKEPYLFADDAELRNAVLYEAAAPRGCPADVMAWSAADRRWVASGLVVIVDRPTGAYLGDPYYGEEKPVDAGQLVYCVYHEQTGSYVPLADYQVRHAVTCRAFGEYPPEADRPTVYPVRFVDLSYRESPGRRPLGYAEKPAPADYPHAHVYDLSSMFFGENDELSSASAAESAAESGSSQSPADWPAAAHESGGSWSGESHAESSSSGSLPPTPPYTYLPEGTVVWCYHLRGQWWVYPGGGGGGGGGGAGDVGSPFWVVTATSTPVDEVEGEPAPGGEALVPPRYSHHRYPGVTPVKYDPASGQWVVDESRATRDGVRGPTSQFTPPSMVAGTMVTGYDNGEVIEITGQSVFSNSFTFTTRSQLLCVDGVPKIAHYQRTVRLIGPVCFAQAASEES